MLAWGRAFLGKGMTGGWGSNYHTKEELGELNSTVRSSQIYITKGKPKEEWTDAIIWKPGYVPKAVQLF